MPVSESVLQSIPEPDLHTHASSETCPTCDQPIPNDKAREVRARAEAQKRRMDEAANARAEQRIAAEKERIKAEQASAIGELREETERALKKASAEADARVEAAAAEGRKLAEADLQGQVAAAQKAREEAEQAAARKLAESEDQKRQALKRLQAMEADRDEQVTALVQEVRDALEKDKAEALATARAANDAETRKLTGQLEDLRRKLEKQRAVELGEGAEVKLFDALKAEFPGDGIRRVPRGVSGADVLHTVMHNGQDCGKIIYDSKNAGAWRNDYVAKLIQDQTAAKADHAVLSTLKFPAGATQLEVRDGVVIVNPARAVAIVRIIRRQMLLVHTLRLSKAERSSKMAELYDFITSERCAHLLGRIDTESDALLELQAAEVRAHQNHWKREGTLVRSLQKAKAELDVDIESIIGARDAEEERP